jgi:hypothetical protein
MGETETAKPKGAKPDDFGARVAAGLAKARERGVKLGSPLAVPGRDMTALHAIRQRKAMLRARRLAKHLAPLVRAGTISCHGLARQLNLQGIRTERGRQWSAKTIAEQLRRLGVY